MYIRLSCYVNMRGVYVWKVPVEESEKDSMYIRTKENLKTWWRRGGGANFRLITSHEKRKMRMERWRRPRNSSISTLPPQTSSTLFIPSSRLSLLYLDAPDTICEILNHLFFSITHLSKDHQLQFNITKNWFQNSCQLWKKYIMWWKWCDFYARTNGLSLYNYEKMFFKNTIIHFLAILNDKIMQ